MTTTISTCCGKSTTDRPHINTGEPVHYCADCHCPCDVLTIHTSQSGHDWFAVTDDYDGAPDSTSIMGIGDTEADAISDLFTKTVEVHCDHVWMLPGGPRGSSRCGKCLEFRWEP